MFHHINLQRELENERSKYGDIMDEVADLLKKSAEQDEEILQRLKKPKGELLDLDMLDESDKDKVFSLYQIKRICVKYRLRFLDSTYFKSEFPYEAIQKIKQFENKYQVKVEKFKIVAPDDVFDLEDVNKDPLLFAQLSDGKYYLIHKWGQDLAWYRSILYYPIRSIYTYFNSIWVLAALFSFAIPFSWLQVEKSNEITMRLWLTIHCFIAFFFFILFLASTTNKNFSENNWKSKYFNS
jgi:hypothetical protein